MNMNQNSKNEKRTCLLGPHIDKNLKYTNLNKKKTQWKLADHVLLSGALSQFCIAFWFLLKFIHIAFYDASFFLCV